MRRRFKKLKLEKQDALYNESNNGIEKGDAVLIGKIKNGDILAFEKLFNTYQGKLLAFVRMSLSYDAEEIVQDVFVRLWERREVLDPQKSLKSYLYTIAKNRLYDYLRKSLYQKKYLEESVVDQSLYDTSEDYINLKETERVLNDLIQLLPEKRRKVFELSRFEGKTYRQISEEMSISENTVDTQMKKALAFLRKGFIKISSYLI
jgi:RNA polymerase sigma-70 factor (ECF subfamily)